MLADATIVEAGKAIGMGKGGVPIGGPGHGNGDGQLGLDDDVHVSPAATLMVNAAGVVIERVEADVFVARLLPLEDFVLANAAGGQGEGECGENEQISHGS